MGGGYGGGEVGPWLHGRRTECGVLDRVLVAVRAGQGQVLVVRGEEGVGKSALLDRLASRAAGCRVARAAGVESEMELAFAGLHQLCAPMLDRRDRLPAPQRNALDVAFGLTEGSRPDQFLVGLAVLSLLAQVSEEAPLICVIDDAQWLDRASAQALTFVARRLLAERVGLVFGVREPVGSLWQGLPELMIEGLADHDALTLLNAAVPGRLDERVRDRILAETRGNPLALLELPRGLTPAELAGGFGRPDARPLANQIEESFLRRVRSLPEDTQRLLLTAAAEPLGDVRLLWRAMDRLGIDLGVAGPAEADGLIEIGSSVRFRHPLVRSAAYRTADAADRRRSHAALAEATDPVLDPDRRAWHRAQAAAGPDEAVAAELVRSADRAQSRGGVAAAAAFLQLATELTPDGTERGLRALAAAQAKFEAAAPDTAYELLAVAELGPLDELRRAQLERLRAQIVFARRRGSDAPPLLLSAARRLEAIDSGLARETYLEALGAALFVGRLGKGRGVLDVAEAASVAPPGEEPPRTTDLLLDGVATRFTAGNAASQASLRRALQAFRLEADRDDGDVMRWLWIACPVAPEPIAPELWDDESWHQLATRAVQLARDGGALAVLPVALSYRAGVHVHAGEFADAAALIEEADAITEATGNAPMRYTSMMLAAWRGEEARTLKLVETGVQDATARGEGRAIGLAGYVTAVLHNGFGRYDAALAGARWACEDEDLGFFGWSLVELVEAAARSDARDEAAEALDRLTATTRASGTDWALGMLARSSALLAEGTVAESLYQEAIERLEGSRIVVHLARAHLLYGEWLRRVNRRQDAREQLRIAYELLARIGAQAFAERARRELEATGASVHQRTDGARDLLTAQEAHIAALAADGLTNPEIAAQLFLSPHTVEWHLRKVFAKLDITSRRQLRVRSA